MSPRKARKVIGLTCVIVWTDCFINRHTTEGEVLAVSERSQSGAYLITSTYAVPLSAIIAITVLQRPSPKAVTAYRRKTEALAAA